MKQNYQVSMPILYLALALGSWVTLDTLLVYFSFLAHFSISIFIYPDRVIVRIIVIIPLAQWLLYENNPFNTLIITNTCRFWVSAYFHGYKMSKSYGFLVKHMLPFNRSSCPLYRWVNWGIKSEMISPARNGWVRVFNHWFCIFFLL